MRPLPERKAKQAHLSFTYPPANQEAQFGGYDSYYQAPPFLLIQSKTKTNNGYIAKNIGEIFGCFLVIEIVHVPTITIFPDIVELLRGLSPRTVSYLPSAATDAHHSSLPRPRADFQSDIRGQPLPRWQKQDKQIVYKLSIKISNKLFIYFVRNFLLP